MTSHTRVKDGIGKVFSEDFENLITALMFTFKQTLRNNSRVSSSHFGHSKKQSYILLIICHITWSTAADELTLWQPKVN